LIKLVGLFFIRKAFNPQTALFMENLFYPASPAETASGKLSVSPAFRQQVSKVMGSILLFIAVYLLLVLAAIGLAIACFYLGIWIIFAMPRFITLLIGVGLMGVGISVIVFLVKFIFAVSKDENPGRVEVTEQEQPQLFAFIRRLTTETNTPFPKKIYVSPDVNACVFYNSSFWSMFLPVRKNLEIGLGLVNSINISEFKAVMAHEFGHFSQRSMKLGSFTYNVNRVIHNMLYDNSNYTAFLNSWGNIHSYLRFFVGITVKIAQGIQWVLRGMYTIINKSYMSLSREMEFHADAVAAGVSGSNNLVSALSRIEVAGNCYATALSDANDRLKENKVAQNIFTNQLTVLRSLAKEYKLPVRQGLPEVSYHFIQSFSRSRINYKNQWASHPTLEERKANLDRLAIEVPADDTSVWQLFNQPQILQEEMTGNLYKSVTLKDTPEQYDNQDFETFYSAKKETYALPPAYKGAYDARYIDVKDWDIDALSDNGVSAKTFEELFNEETGQLQSSITSNQNDLEIVKAIREKRIDVTSFDFDGDKYSRKDCDVIIARLEKEITEQIAKQQSADKEAFIFFLQRPDNKGFVTANYRSYQAVSNRNEEYVALVNKTLQAVHPFYAGGISLDEVSAIVSSLKVTHEPALKKAYRELIDSGVITSEDNKELYDSILDFSRKNYAYFISQQFQNHELDELSGLAIKVAEAFNKYKFACYKKMLIEQLG